MVSRSRVHSLRDLLYARQIDLAIDLLAAASDLHTRIGVLIDGVGGVSKQDAMTALLATYENHWPLHARLMALAPGEVATAWQSIDQLVLRAVGDAGNDANLRARFSELEVAIQALTVAIRSHLGTDPMADETRALFASATTRARVVAVRE